MAADPELSKLDELLDEVGEALGSGDRHLALRCIFRANDELGRRARADVALMDELAGLQSRVNAVTVEVKAGEIAGARRALGDARIFLGSIRRRRISEKEFIQRERRETN